MVGFGWAWLGLVVFGWVLLGFVGFGWVWFGLVGFGWVWLGLVGFGWACSNKRDHRSEHSPPSLPNVTPNSCKVWAFPLITMFESNVYEYLVIMRTINVNSE